MNTVEPHGGKLINRILPEKEQAQAKKIAESHTAILVDDELVKDIKNIARGVYSPLEGFMGKKELSSVVGEMRLSDGTVWSIPIVLDVDETVASTIKLGEKVILRDVKGSAIAFLQVEEVFTFDRDEFAWGVFGTLDRTHPGVHMVYEMKDFLVSGPIDLIDNSKEPYYNYNLDPYETRIVFKEKGWKTVAGFQTRNPSHRAHEYLQKCALELADGLFINPVIGKKKKDDFIDDVILKAYDVLIDKYYPKDRVVLSILPMKMRYAGPREAIFHAIIRKNFGCTHFVVGRDHAGVGDFYGPFDAHDIFYQVGDIGITILRFDNAFYCRKCGGMATPKTCPHTDRTRVKPSGTKIRKYIREKTRIPKQMMRKEIADILTEHDEPFVI